MKILHVNHSDCIGGAARASYRIHNSLVKYGSQSQIISEMRVVKKRTLDPMVFGEKSIFKSLIIPKSISSINQLLRFNFRTANQVLHSTALIKAGFIKE